MNLKFEISPSRAKRPAVMRLSLLLVFLVAVLTACQPEDRTIVVTQKRERTLFDDKYAGNIKDRPPLSWRRIPGTRFRLKNYLAGPEETVEIFLGEAQGETLQNANRWLGQFGRSPQGSLDFFAKVPVLEAQAYLIEADGQYAGGMGQAPKEDYALVGIIRPRQRGVISIKMVGPRDEVFQLRDEFLDYCRNLIWQEVQDVPDDNAFRPETT